MPYTPADDEVTHLIKTVFNRWHRERLHIKTPNEIRIGAIFYNAKTDSNGERVGPPLKLHGYPVAATIKVNSEKHRAQGLPDASITIDGDHWKDLNEKSRIALIDHELEHLERVIVGFVPATDDLHRPKLKCKLHDWQLGGFRIIAERHLEHAVEVQMAQDFATDHGQLLFGFMGPVKMDAGKEKPAASPSTLRIDGGKAAVVDDLAQRLKDPARARAALAELVGNPRTVDEGHILGIAAHLKSHAKAAKLTEKLLSVRDAMREALGAQYASVIAPYRQVIESLMPEQDGNALAVVMHVIKGIGQGRVLNSHLLPHLVAAAVEIMTANGSSEEKAA